MMTIPVSLVAGALRRLFVVIALAQACARLAKHPYVTIDTEFLRETTYYPILCVMQMASPEEAVVVDALAREIDLAPFFELMANERVLKVFHAGRQDI